MANRIIDQKTYRLLLEAYREKPGNATHAGKVAECDRRMALTGWTDGWPKRFEWAKPIWAVIQDEALAARAKQREHEEELRKQTLEARAKGKSVV